MTMNKITPTDTKEYVEILDKFDITTIGSEKKVKVMVCTCSHGLNKVGVFFNPIVELIATMEGCPTSTNFV